MTNGYVRHLTITGMKFLSNQSGPKGIANLFKCLWHSFQFTCDPIYCTFIPSSVIFFF